MCPQVQIQVDDRTLCVILVTDNGRIVETYYENRRDSEVSKSAYEVQLNPVKMAITTGDTVLKLLNEQGLTIPALNSEEQTGATAKTGEELELLKLT